MYLAVLAFLTGVMSLLWFTTIPPLGWFLPALITSTLLWRFSWQRSRPIFQFITIALLGCLFVLWRSQLVLHWSLPENLETKTITVTGTVITLPKIEDQQAQFEFMLDSLNQKSAHAKILLAWYQFPGVALQAGDRWQFQVRLKRPHGLLNPGGFDYEKWLFSRGIRATGYVVNPAQAWQLDTQHWRYPIDTIRQHLEQRLQASLNKEPTAGLIIALIMGAQNSITPEQWQVMRATGTNHLMAIAGVHIAFVAGFIFLIIDKLWRRSSRLLLKVAAPQAAALAMLMAAFIYSALAGFALPTQRALIMLVIFLLGLFFRRSLGVWNALALALFVVLLWDPFAILSISFWLSFGAVAAIIYGISGRLSPATTLWWKYGRVQWVITLALIPISLTLFQQTSLISLVANMIAVPAVGILVLPLCLVGALLLYIFPVIGHWLLIAAAKIIALIWLLLAWLGHLTGAVWQQTMPASWILVASLIGILWLIAPRGIPARWLGLMWLLPLIIFRPPAPAFGAFRFTLLDVGQGLSAVIQTQHHALIFDTGPPMGKQDDAGQRVILPFLHAQGITKIDTLVVSHGDSDHIGGAMSILQQMPVKSVLTSVPERFQGASTHTCETGQTWQWDGVSFRVLYPPPQLLHQNNNSSCVLKISTQRATVLLTGDIEKPAEQYLVAHERSLLPATMLVVPHHGSRTSSTLAFVQAVGAEEILFPVGYKNRFHFPDQTVVARFLQTGATLWDTAQGGAIMLTIGELSVGQVVTERGEERRIWRVNSILENK